MPGLFPPEIQLMRNKDVSSHQRVAPGLFPEKFNRYAARRLGSREAVPLIISDC
jgi:hypothetical protein